MNLQNLPLDLLEVIINDKLQLISSNPVDYQNSLTSLSNTSLLFNQLSNLKLYSNITFYDDDNKLIITHENNRTFIHINQFNSFVNSLTLNNFLKIKSIHINCKSNFNKFEYNQLYTKLNRFWNIIHHSIEIINFDIDNIRKNQTILQHLTKHNYYKIVEENDEIDYNLNTKSSKLYNLKNWSILNLQELNSLPINNNYNLKALDFFIEIIIGDESTPNHKINLPELEQLNLNTSLSTIAFHSLDLNLPNLNKFSLSYSHTFNRPPIDFNQLASKINFENLLELEVKLNCCHSDCSCINQFYKELSNNSDALTKLKKISIINYNSKNQTSNLEQYTYLINNQLNPLFTKFNKIESFYININEFIKNDRCKIDWKNFTKSTSLLPSLTDLVIVDFYNWWLPTIQLTRHSLINTCNCSECHYLKSNFQKLANYDEHNNFTHNFKNFKQTQEQELFSNNIDLGKKSNSKFLSYILNNFKTQFNQSIIYSSSISNYRHNSKILFYEEFKSLLKHNLLNEYINFLRNGKEVLVINLGGVLV
ncbi:hypothetical protein KGF54_004423 [Candida jiufengensis]|uniref:uncharacterized protein n=1 Tax=Candida jiufengensis TaxID=497108 RepID=UPI0022240693|nr:uncharacterized protein KGF54_004423 [Candida jiufengensis]KAI5951349.1 hypothetical protein KGF54_004423 [Candida jiufengensis]